MYIIQFGEVLKFYDALLKGLLVTLELTVLVMLLGTILGIIISFGRISKNKLIYGLSTGYVEFFRNIPLLVLLYIVYYVPPSLFGLRLEAFVAGLIAMTLNSAAYEAEIIRAGIKGIRDEEREAALSLGLSKLQLYRFIIIPHALRLIWEALGNQLIGIILGSCITMIITVGEVTYEGLIIGSRTARHFEVFIILLILYVSFSVITSTIFRAIKRVFMKPAELE